MTISRRAPAAILTCLLGMPLSALAAEDCPLPSEPTYEEQPNSLPVEFTANQAEITDDGLSTFEGSVVVRQGYRQLEAENVRYDERTGKVEVSGKATYREPTFEISARDGDYDANTGEAQFFDAQYVVPSRPARGEARRVVASSEGMVTLKDIKYTTCMEEDPEWQLHAEKMNLDRVALVTNLSSLR